jgi:hypothetical protein
MIHKTTFISMLIALGTGLSTYGLKQKVMTLEDQLKTMNRKIRHYEQSIHLLQAEWSFLNDPERLQNLIEANGNLVPGQTIHLAMDDRFDEQIGFPPSIDSNLDNNSRS